MKAKVDTYQLVTDRILSELEKGHIPWQKPWIRPTATMNGVKLNMDPTQVAYSRSTGKPYSLLNQMLLGLPGEWATFKQIKEAGGHVKKGAESSIIVFWKMLKKTEKNADGEDEVSTIPVLKYFNVFHVETQTEGIEPKAMVETDGVESGWDPIENAELVINHYLTKQGIRHIAKVGDRAFYSPGLDYIQTPVMKQFKDPSEYYSTLLHEMTHSTGHESRLDRFRGPGSHAFGSENYSREELIAEIGAACLVNVLGIETEHSFRNSAAYIENWSQQLKNDPRAIVVASGKAEKAVNLILAE